MPERGQRKDQRESDDPNPGKSQERFLRGTRFGKVDNYDTPGGERSRFTERAVRPRGPQGLAIIDGRGGRTGAVPRLEPLCSRLLLEAWRAAIRAWGFTSALGRFDFAGSGEALLELELLLLAVLGAAGPDADPIAA